MISKIDVAFTTMDVHESLVKNMNRPISTDMNMTQQHTWRIFLAL